MKIIKKINGKKSFRLRKNIKFNNIKNKRK